MRNALESGSSEVRLRTRAEHEGDDRDHPVKLALLLDIIDNGRRRAAKIVARIFFAGLRRADGTGLGLPLAQGVAREHGVRCRIARGPGIRFFPCVSGGDAGNGPAHA